MNMFVGVISHCFRFSCGSLATLHYTLYGHDGYRCVVALMGSNLSNMQIGWLIAEFDTATFLLDPDEAGQKLKAQVIKKLLPRIPVRIIEPEKQVDSMTSEEIKALLG